MTGWWRRWWGPVGAAPQVPGAAAPSVVSAELSSELARVSRGVLALSRLHGDVSPERMVLEVRRQLHGLALAHEHEDLVPLLLLRMAETVLVVEELQRDDGGDG